ncbi:cytochrome c [Dinoroseobacter shibae DFL 12 = DSM 16493]|jgi:sulfur-oxidizing protein SoxX|uniref:Cytochrome c n=1 Tax=Dinoroseobacter shibae (strain DSM 16493 / NCIMB 14021 / DFL 12) TaxID=398580 RepID=A8LJ45_DINSH|nr:MULTISPECIES: sulfur oxidation c-type cytochrome SoxX [Dinoroseobacter]ABV94540.1 cytochrome c [Dinoroseobacter shibae DFL 12 = DSM 16493]MDD9717018.1 sulfur oxidation c-type cytochrome SoxX [Dinoroseobacter sp. PD6]URF45967.1 sulfur oxidation c-type cytochrome SoxX [Dinoroseobacter shibae]URF50273.1 sulfur oxidation c-type cytochrome SoxX [Dinoroseobacter shibae]
MKRQALIGTIAGLAFATGPATAEIMAEQVAFTEYGEIEQSLSGTPGDPAAGREVMASRALGNCVACHMVSDMSDIPFHGEVGPMLDGAGDRWTEAQLRGIVANAKMTFEGTIMPSYYKKSGYIRPGNAFTGKAATPEQLETLLTAQQVEDVVAYLMTLTE